MELVGADSSLTQLGGALVKRAALTPFAGLGAVVLPAPVSKQIGVTKFGKMVTFQVGGQSSEAALFAQLHEKQIGALIDSPIALAPLEYAQELTGLQGRLNRILVEPAPGREAQVRAALCETRGRTAGRRVLRSGRKAVRESRGGDQPVDRAVRRDQRARRVPVRLQRDAPHGAPAPPADRRPAPRRLHARGRDRGAAARRGRARADRDGARARCSATSSRSTSSTPTPAISPRRSRSPPSASSAGRASRSPRAAGCSPPASRCSAPCATSSRATRSPRPRSGRTPAAVRRAGGCCSAGLAALALSVGILLLDPAAAIAGMVSLIVALLLLLPIPLNATLALVKRAAPTDHERRAAHRRDGAALRALAGRRDRRHRRGRGVRRGLDPGRPRRPAEGPRERRAGHQRRHRRVGLGGRQLQPADDHAVRADRSRASSKNCRA